MIPILAARKRFDDLSEQQVLALAISSEEDDARIYCTYADRLRTDYPHTAAIFTSGARARAPTIAKGRRRRPARAFVLLGGV